MIVLPLYPGIHQLFRVLYHLVSSTDFFQNNLDMTAKQLLHPVQSLFVNDR